MTYLHQSSRNGYACCFPLALLNALRFYGRDTIEPGDPAWETAVDRWVCRHGAALGRDQIARDLGVKLVPLVANFHVIARALDGGVPVLLTLSHESSRVGFHTALATRREGKRLEVVNLNAFKGPVVQWVDWDKLHFMEGPSVQPAWAVRLRANRTTGVNPYPELRRALAEGRPRSLTPRDVVEIHRGGPPQHYPVSEKGVPVAMQRFLESATDHGRNVYATLFVIGVLSSIALETIPRDRYPLDPYNDMFREALRYAVEIGDAAAHGDGRWVQFLLRDLCPLMDELARRFVAGGWFQLLEPLWAVCSWNEKPTKADFEMLVQPLFRGVSRLWQATEGSVRGVSRLWQAAEGLAYLRRPGGPEEMPRVMEDTLREWSERVYRRAYVFPERRVTRS